MDKQLNVMDLFCGCGGFSLGFDMAGFNIMGAVDIWEDALHTYHHNFASAAILQRDLSEANPSDIIQELGLNANDIDVIIGGPPCQGFSLSGHRFMNDPRNKLYRAFVDMVDYVKPQVFVMENVPGMLKLFGGRFRNEIITGFSDIGYTLSYAILNAADYGVPQARRRVFIVGLSQEHLRDSHDEFTFPPGTHGDGSIPHITSKEAISDLPLLNDNLPGEEGVDYAMSPQNNYQKSMRNGSCLVYNHIATIHRPRTREIIALVPDGGNYKDLPVELWDTRKVNIAWTRMNSNKPSFTIDTGHNHHFHYLADRVPTVRESARIQSFPDKFLFHGTKTSQLKQVGNAVPPLLARVLAEQILLQISVDAELISDQVI